MADADAGSFTDRIDGEGFAEWYREREWAENIREGRPYFNGPSPVPPPEKHSPSSLLQCHRKIFYRQENAPAEQEEPEGIFWAGTRFEEDVIVPYLADVVHGEDTYVRNSMWVDFEVEANPEPVRFKGATDPCLVDRHSDPLLPTEVKTKEEVDHLDGPNRHHRAQVHAYMCGLTEKHGRDVNEAVVIYGSRKTLNVRTFVVEFDEAFWREVVEWAAGHTEFREHGQLPPAEPEYDWECRFCDYRHRCGQTDEPYANEDPRGFLPEFVDYPREQVEDYLKAHDDAKLTPELAREYPELTAKYGEQGWICEACETSYAPEEVPGDSESQPVCPTCAKNGSLVLLKKK